jgi:hypothetical protein
MLLSNHLHLTFTSMAVIHTKEHAVNRAFQFIILNVMKTGCVFHVSTPTAHLEQCIALALVVYCVIRRHFVETPVKVTRTVLILSRDLQQAASNYDVDTQPTSPILHQTRLYQYNS